jgi:hypothetical protein
MKVIVIDYAFTSDEKLERISDELKLNYELLKKDKKDFSLYRIWVDIDTKTMIAYSTTYSPDKVVFTNGFDELFIGMERYDAKPRELPAPKVDLNIDSILDKISKFGIESLLKEERDFLDKSSK